VPVNRIHQRYMDLLFDRASMERYPSHHLLQRIEEDITDRETAERYVDMLMSEAERHRFPSFHMIDRAERVMKLVAAADIIAEQERQQEQQQRQD
jgi:ribonuclease HII